MKLCNLPVGHACCPRGPRARSQALGTPKRFQNLSNWLNAEKWLSTESATSNYPSFGVLKAVVVLYSKLRHIDSGNYTSYSMLHCAWWHRYLIPSVVQSLRIITRIVITTNQLHLIANLQPPANRKARLPEYGGVRGMHRPSCRIRRLRFLISLSIQFPFLSPVAISWGPLCNRVLNRPCERECVCVTVVRGFEDPRKDELTRSRWTTICLKRMWIVANMWWKLRRT